MIETTVSIYILPTRVRSQIITLTQQIHYLRNYFLLHENRTSTAGRATKNKGGLGRTAELNVNTRQ